MKIVTLRNFFCINASHGRSISRALNSGKIICIFKHTCLSRTEDSIVSVMLCDVNICNYLLAVSFCISYQIVIYPLLKWIWLDTPKKMCIIGARKRNVINFTAAPNFGLWVFQIIFPAKLHSNKVYIIVTPFGPKISSTVLIECYTGGMP